MVSFDRFLPNFVTHNLVNTKRLQYSYDYQDSLSIFLGHSYFILLKCGRAQWV